MLLLSACGGSDTRQQAADAPDPPATRTPATSPAATTDTEVESTARDAARYPCGLTNHADGHQVVRYCGPARARITMEQDAYAVDGGTCERRGDFLLINVGTNYSAESSAAGGYVGLLMAPPSRDGAYDTVSTLELTVDGRRIEIGSAEARLHATKRRVTGTVRGRSADDDDFRVGLRCRMRD